MPVHPAITHAIGHLVVATTMRHGHFGTTVQLQVFGVVTCAASFLSFMRMLGGFISASTFLSALPFRLRTDIFLTELPREARLCVTLLAVCNSTASERSPTADPSARHQDASPVGSATFQLYSENGSEL